MRISNVRYVYRYLLYDNLVSNTRNIRQEVMTRFCMIYTTSLKAAIQYALIYGETMKVEEENICKAYILDSRLEVSLVRS